MKKILVKVKALFAKHYTLHLLLSFIMMLISGSMMFISSYPEISGFAMGGFLISCVRLYTYKNGKLSLFMRDKTFDSIQAKNDEEQANQKYTQMSIISATIGYSVGWMLFLLVLILELVLLIKT